LLRDRVVLASRDVLHVSREEADALAATVHAHFGDEFRPDPVHPQRWYLKYAQAPDLAATPPSVAAGRNIEPLQPAGSEGRKLRAQLNEVQMLFHVHPVNAAREARGEPAVTSLWVWGGGVLLGKSAAPRPVFAASHDARAIGAYSGDAYPLPGEVHHLPANAVVVLEELATAAESGDALGWRATAAQLDRTWFASLARASGLWGREGLRIVDPINGRGVHLRRADAYRFWRRPRPLSTVDWPS